MTARFDPDLLAQAVEVAPITGHQLVYVGDSSNIEARMLAWVAGEDTLLELFRTGGDVYSDFASVLFGRPINKHDDPLERFIGKVCIAEGSLVLTDKGLVPIEKVTLDHKVWDGVRWVDHDGVVYQGYKEVMTYDGLTATPDHKVYAQGYSHPIQIRDAASSMDRLVRSGAGGQAVRVSEDYLPAYTSQERLQDGGVPMHSMPDSQTDQPGQPHERQVQWVPKLLSETIELVHRAWETIRCLETAMHFAERSALRALRGARDHLQLCLQGGVYTLRGAALAASGLQGCGDRPDRQQWPLRAGQSTPCHPGREQPQPAGQHHNPMAGQNNTVGGVPQPLCVHADTSVRLAGDDRGADYRAGLAVCPGEAKGLEATPRKAHVYDILNAGPNRRFTVSGVLVANCVLGLGYGMGWRKFRDTLAVGALGGPPVFFSEEESRNAVNTYRSRNAMIRAYWQQADQAIIDMYLGNSRPWGPLTIHRNCLVLPNGMSLQYPGLRPKEPSEDGTQHGGWEYWNGKFWTNIYGGKLTENIVQALARIALFRQMLDVNHLFEPLDGRVVLNVHDEIVAVGPSYGAIRYGFDAKQEEIWLQADEAQALFDQMMQVMRVPPRWAPDLPLDSEGGFSFEYSK